MLVVICSFTMMVWSIFSTLHHLISMFKDGEIPSFEVWTAKQNCPNVCTRLVDGYLKNCGGSFKELFGTDAPTPRMVYDYITKPMPGSEFVLWHFIWSSFKVFQRLFEFTPSPD